MVNGSLFAHFCSVETLTQAWRVVQDNDLADGTEAPGVARFAGAAEANLQRLSDELAEGSWTPGELTLVEIPKDEGVRTLHIPRVEDRIVARALLDVALPFIDPELGPASFAYRPGLGVVDAVQTVVGLRDEGLSWVARTDVDDCFPHVQRDLAQRRFAALVPDGRLGELVARLGDRVYRTRTGSYRIPAGVPQGCPLSPTLANLVLVDIDNALMSAGFSVVRYADDLAILAPTERDAWEAIRVANEAATELGMQLGADKTRVMSFTESFSFLGEDFNARYPPALTRLAEPDQRVLYVARDGGRVSVQQGRVVVHDDTDTELLDVAQTQVSRIVCFGSVGLSSGARTWALANDIDIVLASRNGNYLGTMLSHEDRYRPARLRAQLAVPSEKGLGISRAIIDAKIHKQRVLLQRAARRGNADRVVDAVGQLGELRQMLPDAHSPQELMGVEGAAARFYFPCLGALMPEELRFELRSRRPPSDVANAALSFLYTILLGECVTALHAVGLEPSIGVLHADDDNRPSLALDLMEEFRPMVVDAVVQRLAAHKELTASHGRREGDATLLTRAGRAAVLAGYENRMLQTTSALPDFTGSIRRHLFRQAQRLRTAIMTDQPFTGMSWR